ncbi:hypothetical protein [Streptomyces tauricus]|uniref:hypothetical protein n=1 Tax=Streptomyces tauricus TaxID=68274 RepID=UPI003433F812
MSDVRECVMPRQVRAAQLLRFTLAFAGLVVMLALSGGLSSYGGRLSGSARLLDPRSLLDLRAPLSPRGS